MTEKKSPIYTNQNKFNRFAGIFLVLNEKVVLNNILAFAKAFQSVSTYVEKTLIGSDNIEETDPVKRVL